MLLPLIMTQEVLERISGEQFIFTLPILHFRQINYFSVLNFFSEKLLITESRVVDVIPEVGIVVIVMNNFSCGLTCTISFDEGRVRKLCIPEKLRRVTGT